jgi:hypothetical protein
MLRALLIFRLGVVFLFVMAALAVLGVWSIGRGSVTAGVLVLAVVAVCLSAGGTLLVHSRFGRK